MEYRPYDRETDETQLWGLKRAFETELGAETGTTAKRAAYEAKLTGVYRERYVDWVDRCTADDPRCVTVAEDDTETAGSAGGGAGGLVGYVFVLPERFAMIWDAAVLNEIYVTEGARGTGVADGLLDRALAVAGSQSLPMDRVVLDVDPDNHRAWGFYERHGFRPWGQMVARPLDE